MTDTQVFQARAPRRTHLPKPLPRSKSTTEEVPAPPPSVLRSQSLTEEREIPFKASAPRRANLQKPAPRSSCNANTLTVEKTLTPNTAKRTADHLIDDVLSDLADSRTDGTRCKLKSQVSVDSGVADCTDFNNSNVSCKFTGRNNSIIEVLEDDGFNETFHDEYLSTPKSHSKSFQFEIEREPISPTSLIGPNDGGVEGILTASGRRRMFQLYRNRCIEREASSREFIQYTADELLEIGTSPLSQKPLESWAYLVHVLPGICLSKVEKYFDAALYQQERGYVVECLNVRGPNRDNQVHNNAQFCVSTSNNSGFSRTINRPRNGFGTPKKNSIDESPFENQNADEKLTTRLESLKIQWPPKNQVVHDILIKSYKTDQTQGLKKQSQTQQPKSECNSVDKSTKVRERLVFAGPNNMIQVHAKNVNLDTKCDVSLRWESGAIKLFAAAKHDLINSRKTFSIPLPSVVDDNSLCARKEKATPCELPVSQEGRPRNAVKPKYYEEDFYINSDLPEKCPW